MAHSQSWPNYKKTSVSLPRPVQSNLICSIRDAKFCALGDMTSLFTRKPYLKNSSQISSTAAEKISAYQDLTTDPSIDLVMASTGGNRSCFLLDEFSKLDIHKPLMGFSDTTALLSCQYKAGIGSIFGPTVQTLARMDDFHLNLTKSLLDGQAHVKIQMEESSVIRQGHVTAPVFAATLSNLASLCGTRFMPDLTGHILIIEDIGDETNRLDRMLWTLDQSINFRNLSGLIFGQFLDATDTGRAYGETMIEILNKYAQNSSIPSIINAPIGHDGRIFPIIAGRKAAFDATNRTLIFE